MAEVQVQIRDGVTGDMLTTEGEPAVLPDDMPTVELVEEILKAADLMPTGHQLVKEKAKIVNKTRGRELPTSGTLAEVGTQDKDILEIHYLTDFGKDL